jgi:hypothetical protein
MGSGRNDLLHLERLLETPPYREILGQLPADRSYARFATWGDVVAFMRARSVNRVQKNELLGLILSAHARDQDPRWRTILLVLFWPGLRSIQTQKRRWDRDDPEELWQRIFWAFHQAICQLDGTELSAWLDARVISLTVTNLGYEYRCQWRQQKRLKLMDPDELAEMKRGDEGIEFAAFEFSEETEARAAAWRRHVDRGLITETDFQLLIGTEVCLDDLKDVAKRLGLSYEAGKKRRQRALATLRKRETRNSKKCVPAGRTKRPFVSEEEDLTHE